MAGKKEDKADAAENTEMRDLRVKLELAEAEAAANAEERDEARRELDGLRNQMLMTQMAIRGIEGERDAARIHAAAMRQVAFPAPPKFPWEV